MLYPEESKKLDFVAHLEELRRRILLCLAVFAAFTVLFFWKVDHLMRFVTRPIDRLVEKLVFIGPTEAFTAYFKVALLAALIVTFPVILCQVGAFLAPAVRKEFRRRVFVWLCCSLVLGLGGAAFAYFLAIPAALKFLMSFGRGVAVPVITLGRYVSFFGALEIAGVIIFQIPIAIGLLADIGIVRTEALRRKRPHAVIAIMVFAAFITPTQDIVNMLIFALPMVLLFEAGLLIGGYLEFRRKTA